MRWIHPLTVVLAIFFSFYENEARVWKIDSPGQILTWWWTEEHEEEIFS